MEGHMIEVIRKYDASLTQMRRITRKRERERKKELGKNIAAGIITVTYRSRNTRGGVGTQFARTLGA